VIAAVDVECLAGNQLGAVHAEKGDRNADIVDGNRLRVGAFDCALCRSSSKA
jgi:hypothetical protein